jgi:hypothetical protein
MNARLTSLAVVLVTGISGSAYASPSPPTVSVQDGLVELSWSDGKEQSRVALPLPVALSANTSGQACSTAEIDHDRRHTSVTICRVLNEGDGAAPVIDFSVQRDDASTPQHHALKFRARARLRRGASMVIGRFEPSDVVNELVATLR